MFLKITQKKIGDFFLCASSPDDREAKVFETKVNKCELQWNLNANIGGDNNNNNNNLYHGERERERLLLFTNRISDFLDHFKVVVDGKKVCFVKFTSVDCSFLHKHTHNILIESFFALECVNPFQDDNPCIIFVVLYYVVIFITLSVVGNIKP